MKRNSSIELLKVITMILIIVSHCAQSFNFSFGIASESKIELLFNFIRCFGQFGNIVFIICSAWFLIEKNTIKPNKIIFLILNSFIISIFCLFLCITLKIDFTRIELLKQFAPFIFENNWFIKCYIILYFISPYLNIIIYKLNGRELFKFVISMFISLSVIQFIFKDSFFFNELIGFIYIYFIVGFYKLYVIKYHRKLKFHSILFFMCLIINIALLVINNTLGLKFEFMKTLVLYWNLNMSNPFYILMGLSLFSIFLNFKIDNDKVNLLSSLSLNVYLFHENYLLREYVRPVLCFIFLENNGLVVSLIYTILIVVLFSYFVSFIYTIIFDQVISRVSLKINNVLKKIYIKIEDKIFNCYLTPNK